MSPSVSPRRVLTSTAVLFLFSANAGARSVSLSDCISASWSGAVVIVPARPALRTAAGPPEPGDRIAALAPDGSCVGSSTWTGGGTTLSVWADDPMTDQADGLRAGDPLSLVVIDPSETKLPSGPNATVTFEAQFAPEGGFEVDALYIVASGVDAPPPVPVATARLGSAYPNPVADRAQIPFHLNAETDVVVEVFDALGRQVVTLWEGRLGAGDHRVPFDAAGLAGGIYVYRLRAGEATDQGTLVISR